MRRLNGALKGDVLEVAVGTPGSLDFDEASLAQEMEQRLIEDVFPQPHDRDA